MKRNKGFTLIELLVVIAIISLLSSIVFASMTSVRKKSRDSQRIQNARQIATALELYEQTYSTYKVTGSGLSSNPGTGYVTKTGGTYSGTSILSTLKQSGFLKTDNLKDPIFADNYYIGLCTSTNAYNVFVKLEQDQYNQATSSIINTCGGTLASNEGFSFIGATTGGTSGGGAGSIAGSYEAGMIPSGGGSGDILFNGLTYKEVLGADGKIWLDRNLGALQVANAFDDHLAYGDLYQWGRLADGHEKITRTGPTTATAVNGTTLTLSPSINTTGNTQFIRNISSPWDWLATPNNGLWDKTTGLNNPCPSSFHVPTQTEWDSLVTISNITNSNTAFNSSLKLTAAGSRFYSNGNLSDLGFGGYYWSSSVYGTNAEYLNFDPDWAGPDSQTSRANGYSIRCIKD